MRRAPARAAVASALFVLLARPAAPGGGTRVDAVVSAAADEALTRGPLPGLSAAVLQDGVQVFAGGFGLAEIDNEVRASASTVYRINSITKGFTAVGILQLVEAGKLHLDDRLSRYFPEYTRPGHDPTLAQMLRHTSGMTSYAGDVFHRDIRLDLSPREWVDSVNGARLYEFVPDERWSYSNAAYDVLGLIIEKVSGETPGDYFARHILRIAGMTSTRMCNTPDVVPNRAFSYQRGPSGWVHARSWGTYGDASDRLCSTVVDLGRFWNALASGRLLGRALLGKMDAPGTVAGRAPLDYGLGVRLGHLDGHPLVALTGSGEMWTSALVDSPRDHWTVIVLTNTENDRDSAARVAVEILRRLADVPRAPVSDSPVPPELSSRLSGLWGEEQPATLSASGGHLMMGFSGAPFPPFALEYAGRADFRAPAGSPAAGLELLFDTREPLSVQAFTDGIFERLELKQRH